MTREATQRHRTRRVLSVVPLLLAAALLSTALVASVGSRDADTLVELCTGGSCGSEEAPEAVESASDTEGDEQESFSAPDQEPDTGVPHADQGEVVSDPVEPTAPASAGLATSDLAESTATATSEPSFPTSTPTSVSTLERAGPAAADTVEPAAVEPTPVRGAISYPTPTSEVRPTSTPAPGEETPTPTATVATTSASPTPTATTAAGQTATPSPTAEPTPVRGGPATASPTATPTLVATATPAATATPTPGVGAGSTPTPTPTSTPTPAATPTPTPAATPTSTPTPAATPTPTPTPSGPQPFGQPGGNWQLIFEDDFDTLDESVWETAWFSSNDYTTQVNQAGGACFHPRQVAAIAGELDMRLDPNEDPRCLLKSGEQADFVGSLINTRKSFTFSYGYAEARMYLPGADGSLYNWPAFWHTGFDWPATGEVDIAEGLSGGQPCAVYHYEENGEHQQDKDCVDWADPTGWHVFAADWAPGRITFYYDGIQVFETTQGIVGDPHYLIFDHTVRANGVGTNAPATMRVDYVRVWQSAN